MSFSNLVGILEDKKIAKTDKVVILNYSPIEGPSQLGKSCIRGGCASLNTFDATDYESAFVFSENV